MLYLVLQTSAIILVTAALFFWLGAFFQRRFRIGEGASREAWRDTMAGAPATHPHPDWTASVDRLAEALLSLAGQGDAARSLATPPATDTSAPHPQSLDRERARIEGLEHSVERLSRELAVRAASLEESVGARIDSVARETAQRCDRVARDAADRFSSLSAPSRAEIPAIVRPLLEQALSRHTADRPGLQEISGLEMRITAIEALASRHAAQLAQGPASGTEMRATQQIEGLRVSIEVTQGKLRQIEREWREEISALEAGLSRIEALSRQPSTEDPAARAAIARLETQIGRIATASASRTTPDPRGPAELAPLIARLDELASRMRSVESETGRRLEELGISTGDALATLATLGPRVTKHDSEISDLSATVAATEETAETVEEEIAPRIAHMEKTLTELKAARQGRSDEDIQKLRKNLGDQLVRIDSLAGSFERLDKSRSSEAAELFEEIQRVEEITERYALSKAEAISGRLNRLEKSLVTDPAARVATPRPGPEALPQAPAAESASPPANMVAELRRLLGEKQEAMAQLEKQVRDLTSKLPPELTGPDDLSRVRGIGQKTKKFLKETLGITTYKELAEISADKLDRLGDELLYHDRALREDWIGQARELHLQKYSEELPINASAFPLKWSA